MQATVLTSDPKRFVGQVELTLRNGRAVLLTGSHSVVVPTERARVLAVVAHTNTFLEEYLGRVVVAENDAQPFEIPMPSPHSSVWSHELRVVLARARCHALASALHGDAVRGSAPVPTSAQPVGVQISVSEATRHASALRGRVAAARAVAADLLSQLCPAHPLHAERRAGVLMLSRRPSNSFTSVGIGVHQLHGCKRCHDGLPSSRVRHPPTKPLDTTMWLAQRCWVAAHLAALLAIALARWKRLTITAVALGLLGGGALGMTAWAMCVQYFGTSGPFLVLDDAAAQWRMERRPNAVYRLCRFPHEVLLRGSAAHTRCAQVRDSSALTRRRASIALSCHFCT